MKYRILFLPAANDNLADIIEYLAGHSHQAAQNFYADLDKRLDLLEDMPFMCEAYEHDRYFRKMVIGKYLLFYAVKEEAGLIEIHRILHSAQDIRRLMDD